MNLKPVQKMLMLLLFILIGIYFWKLGPGAKPKFERPEGATTEMIDPTKRETEKIPTH